VFDAFIGCNPPYSHAPVTTLPFRQHLDFFSPFALANFLVISWAPQPAAPHSLVTSLQLALAARGLFGTPGVFRWQFDQQV
jgi:hypothetical protein